MRHIVKFIVQAIEMGDVRELEPLVYSFRLCGQFWFPLAVSGRDRNRPARKFPWRPLIAAIPTAQYESSNMPP